MSHQHYFTRQKPRLLLTLWWFTLSGPSYGPEPPFHLHNYYFKSSLMVLFMMQTFQCERCVHVCAHCVHVSVHPAVWLLPAGPPPFRWIPPPACPDLWPCRGSCLLLTQIWGRLCVKNYIWQSPSFLWTVLYKVSLISLHGRSQFF